MHIGASMVGYFDPMSSPTIVPKKIFLQTGFKIAQYVLPKINGAKMFSVASGRILSILDELKKLDIVAITGNHLENIVEIKKQCEKKLTVIGNLDFLSVRHWTPQQIDSEIKELIKQVGPGGGFAISDNHGEVPWQIQEDTLTQIRTAVNRWGNYPIDENE